MFRPAHNIEPRIEQLCHDLSACETIGKKVFFDTSLKRRGELGAPSTDVNTLGRESDD